MEPSATYPVKRILILGASGQIGKLLHEHLTLCFPETDVTGCVRSKPCVTGKYILFNPFTDDWQKLGKADVLINCIGIIQETGETTFEQAHEGITRLILKNRHSIGNPRIIQISALGADENSPLPFLQTKARADKLLLDNPDTVGVRPSVVCTPDTMMVRKLRLLNRISKCLLHYLPFPENLLQTRIQPIMPHDLAAVIERICQLPHPPALIHAVGPFPLSLEQLIRLSSRQPVTFIKLPKKTADALVKLIGFLVPGLLKPEQYQLLQTDNVYPVEEIERVLNYKLRSSETFWQETNKL